MGGCKFKCLESTCLSSLKVILCLFFRNVNFLLCFFFPSITGDKGDFYFRVFCVCSGAKVLFCLVGVCAVPL